MVATPLAVFVCGLFVGMGFLFGGTPNAARQCTCKTAAAMSAIQPTSKAATFRLWLVAVSQVLTLALFKVIQRCSPRPRERLR